MCDEGYYRKKLDEIAPLLAEKDRLIGHMTETSNENAALILTLQKRVEELEDMVMTLTQNVPCGTEL